VSLDYWISPWRGIWKKRFRFVRVCCVALLEFKVCAVVFLLILDTRFCGVVKGMLEAKPPADGDSTRYFMVYMFFPLIGRCVPLFDRVATFLAFLCLFLVI
jgi:hypothetical protein